MLSPAGMTISASAVNSEFTSKKYKPSLIRSVNVALASLHHGSNLQKNVHRPSLPGRSEWCRLWKWDRRPRRFWLDLFPRRPSQPDTRTTSAGPRIVTRPPLHTLPPQHLLQEEGSSPGHQTRHQHHQRRTTDRYQTARLDTGTSCRRRSHHQTRH